VPFYEKSKRSPTGAIILAVASSAVAFKTAKFHTANLYYLNTSSVCKLSTNATNKPGSMGFPIHEPDFYLAILQIGSLSVCNQDVNFCSHGASSNRSVTIRKGRSHFETKFTIIARIF